MRDGIIKYFNFVVIGSGVVGFRYVFEVVKYGIVVVIIKVEFYESNINYV